MDIHVDEATAPDRRVAQHCSKTVTARDPPSGSMAMLEQPCVTFARIAAEFGVTRECVRLWHQRSAARRASWASATAVVPRASDEAAAARRCAVPPLLSPCAIVGAATPRHADSLARRIPQAHRVVSMAARSRSGVRAGAGARLALVAEVVYTLANAPASVDLVYYELSVEDYLLVPRACLSAGPVTYVDTDASTYQRFKNTLAALSLRSSLQVEWARRA